MKTVKRSILSSNLFALTYIAILILAFSACEKGGENLTLSNSSELTQTAFAEEETTGKGFTFTAKSDWTASVKKVSNQKSNGVSWLKLLYKGAETYSGGAGTFTMTISLIPNYLGKTRTATIEIVSGDDKITITVTQSGTTKKGGMIMSEIAVFKRIIALKERYPEGMRWTNDSCYRGCGCYAFAFIVSDAAFGNLPVRWIYDDFNNLRIGDHLRINDNTHSVVIIGINEKNITFTEGNYNSSIHWGRQMTIEKVKSIINYIITRYPEDKPEYPAS